MHAGEAIVVMVAVLLVLVPWIVLRDIRAYDPVRWRQAGHVRAVWIALVVLVPLIGVLLYLRWVRPRLLASTPGTAGARGRAAVPERESRRRTLSRHGRPRPGRATSSTAPPARRRDGRRK